jgi:hypothetical protein
MEMQVKKHTYPYYLDSDTNNITISLTDLASASVKQGRFGEAGHKLIATTCAAGFADSCIATWVFNPKWVKIRTFSSSMCMVPFVGPFVVTFVATNVATIIFAVMIAW